MKEGRYVVWFSIYGNKKEIIAKTSTYPSAIKKAMDYFNITKSSDSVELVIEDTLEQIDATLYSDNTGVGFKIYNKNTRFAL